ncbi:sigma-70 family RNA polymerase sigma factor [Jeotgalibacillus sp. S-D1]|uniref:sigma-70 family RNA polymerase sigma factor n=1 Tax=Jeotgalibacillus sp. S-D1 TaxID=2552189 RepID=UPI00105A3101|nr:sigma-70 family RNA polymerase sigma factor [Jeotgalibacillus sp. S-D1]TDL32070.1 sigma-70 family RNA polymerase sigma factor [Jeotgalibacillus sp. S-D1]
MAENDEDLIQRAKSGNHEALAILLKQHYQFLFSYLLKLTLHPSAAEDLTQETMVRCIERFYQYDSQKAAFTTWMIQIGTNLWMDEKRRKKRENAYLNKQQLSWKLNEASTTEWIAVTAALKTLKDIHRIPVILKHYYGYSYEEMASICQVSVGTIKSRLNNGLTKLRKELGEHEST